MSLILLALVMFVLFCSIILAVIRAGLNWKVGRSRKEYLND